MKVIFTILVFLSLAIGLSCQTRETNRLTTQEFEIYKTILGDRPKETVVINESMAGIFGEIAAGGLKQILSELQNDTFDNFIKMNASRTKIEGNLQTGFEYPITTKADFEKKNLKPSGYYAFSRVGFSDDGRQAVLIFIDVCEPLCSKGKYFLLANKNGFWEIAQESESWRS
ncbi:MAG: hypothetical protein M3384_05275 [Acidobacteriota bacterium]|nr:hypothetical protein [Acidobacteriota bacterium]